MFNKKWFLFIEWSILTVTIFTGIFSAALFPSLTSYLARGRDVSRMAGIKEISTAIAAYGIDKQSYPAVPESGCIPAKDLAQYLPKIPIDPVVWRISNWCDGSDGMTYVYRILKNNQEWPTVIVQADLENSNWWNSNLTIDEILKLDNPMNHIENLRKWDGSYYIIYN